MEITIRYQVNDSVLIRLGIELKNSKNGGVSINVVFEHPLLVFFRYIFAYQPYPVSAHQLNSKFDSRSAELCQITTAGNTIATSDAQGEQAEPEKSISPFYPPQDKPPKSISLLQPAYSQQLAQLVAAAQEGLLAGHKPDLCEEGVNGTYFFKNKEGKRIAVFKPQDEEGNSTENPKNKSTLDDLQGKGGIREGEASQREVAAYLLDKEHFFGVPATQMVSVSHPYFLKPGATVQMPKVGSFQEYVDSDGCSEQVSVSAFSKKQVHKIGILDLQIFNMDRHGGNILFQKTDNGDYRLTPIDHGFSLPDSSGLGNAWFDWLTWPQAKEKFDEDTKQYIQNIDLEEDLATLGRELGIRRECLRTMKITTTLLKKAVAKNLTLFDVGVMVCRHQIDRPSELEIICSIAEEQTNLASPPNWEDYYFSCLCQLMDLNLLKQGC